MCFITKDYFLEWGVGENDAGLEVNPNSLFEADALCTQLESKGKKKKKLRKDHSKAHSYHYKRNATGNVLI